MESLPADASWTTSCFLGCALTKRDTAVGPEVRRAVSRDTEGWLWGRRIPLVMSQRMGRDRSPVKFQEGE